MVSNYPPGVSDNMIPGNRPEDQEIEFVIYLTKEEVDLIAEFVEDHGPAYKPCNAVRHVVEAIYNQITGG